jgi:hypothetical protein
MDGGVSQKSTTLNTRLVATSKLGLPYHLPRSLRDFMLQGKPFHLRVQEVKR